MNPPFHLPRCLIEPDDEPALDLLRRYYAPAEQGWAYSGSRFNAFDPSGTRSASADVFTADDVVSLTLLSVVLPGSAALLLLDGAGTNPFNQALSRVPADRDLVDVDSVDEAEFGAAWALWRLLRDLPGVGPTITSKLMARKRPRLIPIYDSVINAYVLRGSGQLWHPLHAALQADSGELHHRLLRLREGAGLCDQMSAIRVFDILAWMEGRRSVAAAVSSDA